LAECLSFHFTPFNPTEAEYASTYHEGSESHFEPITHYVYNFSGNLLVCANLKIISPTPTPTSCATGETGHQCQPGTLIIKSVHDVICT